MKDKRLDALLATLPVIECKFYNDVGCGYFCKMVQKSPDDYQGTYTNCQGDIRKCERE